MPTFARPSIPFAGYLTTTLPKLTFAGDEAPYVSHVPWPRSPAASQACPWYTSHDKNSPPRSALDPLLSLRQCWPRHGGGSGHSSYWQDTDKRHPDMSSHHIAAPASQARNATRYQWSRCLSSVSIIPRLRGVIIPQIEWCFEAGETQSPSSAKLGSFERLVFRASPHAFDII